METRENRAISGDRLESQEIHWDYTPYNYPYSRKPAPMTMEFTDAKSRAVPLIKNC